MAISDVVICADSSFSCTFWYTAHQHWQGWGVTIQKILPWPLLSSCWKRLAPCSVTWHNRCDVQWTVGMGLPWVTRIRLQARRNAMTIGFAVDNVTKISFVSCVSTCAVGHLHDTCNVSIYRHRIYWDLLLAWVQNYYNSKDVILYSSVCTFSHLIPHVSAISTEHASKFNHLCYAKARPCFGLLVSLQWLKASKRIKLRVSLCFHPWLRMDPKLRDRKHPRQTRALCTLGRFSASSLQAFNLSIKVWSRQHKDLRINTLAKVPGWGLAEPHGRLHMSEKYVSKLYTLHFVSWFPFRFLQTMTFLRKWEEFND